MDRKKRRVAVVVFGELDSLDERDAEAGLMLAVRQALSDCRMRLPQTIEGMGASGLFQADIFDVVGLGMAASNGYISVKATNKSYREAGAS